MLHLPGQRTLPLDRPLIMGVLNLTPDSFSDGGQYPTAEHAITSGGAMLEAGADIIDVGGESTRPGAARIPANQQIERTLPVIEQLVERHRAIISIDTTREPVARAALDCGAAIINDVSAGREDKGMFALAAQRHTPLVLMHMRGQPATMQNDPTYDDVVAEVRAFLLERAAAAQAAGVEPGQIILDPGIGFGKTTQHNLQLLGALDQLVATGYPVLLGTSRKRFLGQITGRDEPTDRDVATAATTAMGVTLGVRLFRVHAVAPNRQAADVTFAAIAHRNR